MVISPMNPVWLGMSALFAGLLAAGSLLLRKKSEKLRERVLCGVMLATFLLFWYYKWQVSLDEAYAALKAETGMGTGTFTWWDELPLQLCNINIMLVPLAVLTRKRPLMSFCALVGPLGAAMALLMPQAGFAGYSLALPRVWGYYVTHYMVIVGCFAVITLGFYRPRYSDILPGVLTTLALSLVIFLINMLLRKTGIHPYANYFFNVDTEGNAILELTRNLIPIPYLYQVPLVGILAPYMLLVTALLRERKKK